MFRINRLILLFCTFTLSVSFSQPVEFYPPVDSVFIMSGCTQPMIKCKLSMGINYIDTIRIWEGPNTKIYYYDSLKVQRYLDFCYFTIEDSAHQNRYELFLISTKLNNPYSFFLPFDSSIICVFYTRNAGLALLIKRQNIVIDSICQKVYVFSTGYKVEPPRSGSDQKNKFILQTNYPNPFNPLTKISIMIPNETKIDLSIYDISGREIRKIYSGQMQPGRYSLEWDGKDNKGNDLPSGVYFSRLTTKSGNYLSGKMLLIR